jgi:hypothetical protein
LTLVLGTVLKLECQHLELILGITSNVSGINGVFDKVAEELTSSAERNIEIISQSMSRYTNREEGKGETQQAKTRKEKRPKSKR